MRIFRLVFLLAMLLALSAGLVSAAVEKQAAAPPQRPAAERAKLRTARVRAFMSGRTAGGSSKGSRSAAELLMRARRQALAQRRLAEANAAAGAKLAGAKANAPGAPVTWQPVGPLQIASPAYGLVTGRVTSIAIDPNDTAGNTVYAGTTGGGVWKSKNAAGSPGSVAFTPLTDDLPVFSGGAPASLSIGAVSVQPGGTGVILAGTGDVNDALDSYWGTGILRSSDSGASWSLITESSDEANGTGPLSFSFLGVGFAGFAWSTKTAGLVVAAVSSSTEGELTGASPAGQVAQGLYYSTDAGMSWSLATISDGAGKTVQTATTSFQQYAGNPVTAVVWNPVRQLFFAAVRFHGFYSSPDGVTWTRLTSQPGTALTAVNCPVNTGLPGAPSCPMGRGALAINMATGDTFAFYVDQDDYDQGMWQDSCGLAGGVCANAVSFGVQIDTSALEDIEGFGTIPQGLYNLWVAAVPVPGDTLLLAGTEDIFRCGLGAGCEWRNTTNTQTCAAARVGPSQHAVDFLPSPPGTGVPLLYFGNDSGLWRSTDAVNQQQPECWADDAAHFDNLNGSLGSLGEMVSVASDPVDATILLGGAGANGTAASTTGNESTGMAAWPQLSDGEGGVAAIDPVTRTNWYVSTGPGVSIAQCTSGSGCGAEDIAGAPGIGEAQVEYDDALVDAPYLLDPANPANVILGTCRVWRGPASGGSAWPEASSANVVSPMLDGSQQPFCNGNTPIRSLGAGGLPGTSENAAAGTGSSVIYAGMAGLGYGVAGYGGTAAGHLFSTVTANQADGSTAWQDLYLSPVSNDLRYNQQFNPAAFDISSVYVDPHDASGNTVYATVMGFSYPHLYWSTNGGQTWLDVSSNLPDAPANAVLVDAGSSIIVYVALDTGVYVTNDVRTCPNVNCWTPYGSGLPNAPVVGLSQFTYGLTRVLRAATYGRGVWETPLAGPPPTTTLSLTPGALSFAGQGLGSSSAAQTVTVTNTGTGGNLLQVTGVTVSGDFAEQDSCVGSSLTAGQSCAVQVTFTPTALGERTGTLTVAANVPDGQATASLSGTGLPGANVVLDPTMLSFAPAVIGVASAAQNVTISNTGATGTTLASVTASGDFSVTANTCGVTLPASSGCTVSVMFTPTAAGARTGTLMVVDGQGTQTAALSGTGQAPATDGLAPLSLSFAAQVEGTSSAAQAVTLTNGGDVALAAIAVSVTNQDFGVVNNCGNSLNGKSSCTLMVSFTPHSRGAESGVLTVTDLIHTQTVMLTGTGLAPPTDTLQPASLTFAALYEGAVSAAQSITMTNSGDVALTGIQIQSGVAGKGTDYKQTNTCGSQLAAGASCAIAVTFAPTMAGADLGVLAVTDVTRTQSVPLTGTGLAPDILSATALSFPAQVEGKTSAPMVVMLSNFGPVALTGIQIGAATNADFQATSSCGATLAAGASCAIRVTFTPTTAGQETGTLAVTDADRTQMVSLSGTGQAPAVDNLSPTSLTFAAQIVSVASAAQRVTLSNSSGTTLAGIAVKTDNPDFAVTTGCGSTLAGGASCAIDVVNTPSVLGVETGSLIVADATRTQMIPLSGTGLAPDVLSATSLTFSSQVDGTTSAAQNVILTNRGTIALSGLAISISAGGPVFFETNTCGSGLAAGSSCTIGVSFAPQSAGAVSGILTVADSLHSQTVALSGTGQAGAQLVVSPAVLNFGTTAVGVATAAQTVTVTNAGSAGLQGLTITAAGAAANADYLFSLECGSTLAAGASCTIAIIFDPIASGPDTGTLTVASANGGMQTVTLNGTGSGSGFELTAISAQTVTVSSGQTANYMLSLVPAAGSTGTAEIACSANPAPAHSSCGLSPASASLTAATAITLTVKTGVGGGTAAVRAPAKWPWAVALLLPFGVVLRGGSRWKRSRRKHALLLGGLLLVATMVAGPAGCGSHGIVDGVVVGDAVTPPGTYTYTATATAEGMTRSIALTLIVK